MSGLVDVCDQSCGADRDPAHSRARSAPASSTHPDTTPSHLPSHGLFCGVSLRNDGGPRGHRDPDAGHLGLHPYDRDDPRGPSSHVA